MTKRLSNIIVVHIGDLLAFPPTLNVANLLCDEGYRVRVITTSDHSDADYKKALPAGVALSFLESAYSVSATIPQKIASMLSIRKELWKLIDDCYVASNSLIWVSSEVAMKHLGHRIVRCNYVFHVMELAERIRYRLGHDFPAMDTERIGNNALAIVVPERTRAHITKAWWNLRDMPLVLPNKPVESGSSSRGQLVSDAEARRALELMSGKKIILYQGITHRERPLRPYLDAVEMLGCDFAFATMGSEDPLKGVVSDRYVHIPYVEAPKHLEITSNAYIGVLSYFPFKGHVSILNPLFCAPNKTFEYAKFGIPMLGNDNPNLDYIFEKWGCGSALSSFEGEVIAKAIETIDSHYPSMSAAARNYYDSVDMPALIRDIMDAVELRLAGREGGDGSCE